MAQVSTTISRRRGVRGVLKKTFKAFRVFTPLAVGIYFIPYVVAFYICCGVLDFIRNRKSDLATADRYFTGNGVFTWLLSPFNLLMDLLTLPYLNKGVYKLAELPQGHQDEINALIRDVHEKDLVGELDRMLGENKRGMIFFKWYGRNLKSKIDVPEFHRRYKYIRTIGVSIFNKKHSTSKHFGPLRVTFRVLYNINAINDRSVYIQVGDHVHHWQDEKLFIFDDTLQHQSCNGSNELRYCMFVDILRPSLCRPVLATILFGLRLVIAPLNSIFYNKWTFLK